MKIVDVVLWLAVYVKSSNLNCRIGHVFSDGSVRSEGPSGCSCFYNKVFMESDVEYEWDVDFAPSFNEDPDPKDVGKKLLMDLWKPPGSLGVRPGIIIVHGGNCRSGSRKEGREHAMDLARRGWVAATIDYRLLSTERSCRTKGSIEAAGNDAKAAVRFLEANANKLLLDRNRIAIMGCSAGGRTSMYASYVRGNGIQGGTWRNSFDYSNYPANISACVEMSADLYAPQQHPPVITSHGPPLMILHGADDPNNATPCSVAEDNYRQALAAGIYAEKYIIPGGHCPNFPMHKIINFLYKALSLKSLHCHCNNTNRPNTTPHSS